MRRLLVMVAVVAVFAGAAPVAFAAGPDVDAVVVWGARAVPVGVWVGTGRVEFDAWRWTFSPSTRDGVVAAATEWSVTIERPTSAGTKVITFGDWNSGPCRPSGTIRPGDTVTIRVPGSGAVYLGSGVQCPNA